MTIIQHPISGVVAVGTVTGDVLYSFPYTVQPTEHVAPVMLKAFQAVWDALPDVLGAHGAGRFDLLVRQSSGTAEAVPTYWQSGLSAGGLCGLVARRLRQIRAGVQALQPRPAPVEVFEVLDPPKDYSSVDWVQPNVSDADRVRQQLASIIWKEYE